MRRLILIPLLLLSLLGFTQGGPPTTSTLMDGNWSNTGIWSNGIPTSNKSATINHIVTLDQAGITKNLTINGSVTNGGYLLQFVNFTNNGSYTDNGGTNEIRQNGTVSGNDTYFYNFSSKGGKIQNIVYIKNLLNLPTGVFNVSGGSLILLNDGTNDGRLGVSTGSISGNFVWQKYINNCQGWSMFSYPADATLSSVVSYPTWTAYYDETDTNPMDYGWNYFPSNGIASQGQGVISYDLAYSKIITLSVGLSANHNFTLDYTNTGSPLDDGWNMVGNPYPGTIDWDNANWTKTNVSDAIYTWIACSGQYGSYVGGLGTGGMDNLIPSGEAFWVQTIGVTPALTAPKSVIVDGSAPMMKMGNSPTNTLRITLNGDDIIINVFRGTDYFDYEYDAIKMGVGNLKTIDDDGVEYSINSLPNKQQTIPLWTNGSGEMSFEKIGFQNSWKVYLEDTYSGSIDLIDNAYTHNVNSGSYEHRYNIIFTKKPIIIDQAQYQMRYQGDQVIITSDEVMNVEVYDMMGRVIQSEQSSNVSVKRKNLKFIKINDKIEKIY
jgi:hypothetical protein